MSLPSLDRMLGDAGRTAARFPLVILAAAVCAVAAATAVGQSDPTAHIRVLLSAQLGIPLLIALTLLGERTGRLKLPLLLGGVCLLLLHYAFTPDPGRPAAMSRFIQFNVVAHLLVAFLPHLRRGEDNGFWQYNKTLFLRLLGSLIFTGVLIAGLDIALLALDQLFGLPIEGRYYGRLNLVLLFAFNTWYFLGGVPQDWAGLEGTQDYPRGLKVFAQYILSPLVAVYLALLTAYLVKVIITTEWPSGWIGWLVTSVAAAGFLSLALLHPLIERMGNRWIATYARAYFILMLPAVGMQMMAIGQRIGQYGVTENRYFICILALWLLVVSLLGAFNRLKSLQPLPLTLCALALITSFGPWGAYSISRGSQVARLEAQLTEGGMLVDGALTPVSDVPHEARREISALLDYLLQHHGPHAIEHWLTAEQSSAVATVADSLSRRHDHRALSRRVMGYLELEYVDRWQREPGSEWHYFNREGGGEGISLSGFDVMYPVTFPNDRKTTVRFQGRDLEIDQADDEVTLTWLESTPMTIQLGPMLARLLERRRATGGDTAPDSLLVAGSRNESIWARLHVSTVNWRESEVGPEVQHLTGYLLLAVWQ